jgi:spermidine synthase
MRIASGPGGAGDSKFFDLMRRRLKPGGFAVTYRSTDRSTRSFVRAFPHLVAITFGRRYEVLIGSDRPIHFDRASFLEKLQHNRVVRSYYARAGVDILQLLAPTELAPVALLARYAGDSGEINTDIFPKDEFTTPGPLPERNFWGRPIRRDPRKGALNGAPPASQRIR